MRKFTKRLCEITKKQQKTTKLYKSHTKVYKEMGQLSQMYRKNLQQCIGKLQVPIKVSIRAAQQLSPDRPNPMLTQPRMQLALYVVTLAYIYIYIYTLRRATGQSF